MFHHTVRRLKIHSKRIFLVAVFGGIYILGVFLKPLTLPYKVTSDGTAQHTALESLLNNIDGDGSIHPPHYQSVISQHLLPRVGFCPPWRSSRFRGLCFTVMQREAVVFAGAANTNIVIQIGAAKSDS